MYENPVNKAFRRKSRLYAKQSEMILKSRIEQLLGLRFYENQLNFEMLHVNNDCSLLHFIKSSKELLAQINATLGVNN